MFDVQYLVTYLNLYKPGLFIKYCIIGQHFSISRNYISPIGFA
jgi:hypothetical protein